MDKSKIKRVTYRRIYKNGTYSITIEIKGIETRIIELKFPNNYDKMFLLRMLSDLEECEHVEISGALGMFFYF
jgi:hypothetical protein